MFDIASTLLFLLIFHLKFLLSMKMSLIVILVLFPFLLTLMPSSEKDDFPSDYNPFSIVIFTPVRIMHTNSILIAEFKKELRGVLYDEHIEEKLFAVAAWRPFGRDGGFLGYFLPC